MAYADNYTKQKKKLFNKILEKEVKNAKTLSRDLDLSNEELKTFYERLVNFIVDTKH